VLQSDKFIPFISAKMFACMPTSGMTQCHTDVKTDGMDGQH
jgi:hypothetical protein